MKDGKGEPMVRGGPVTMVQERPELDRDAVARLLWQELCALTSEGIDSEVEEDRLLSQAVSSAGFLRLLLVMERKLELVVDDEDLYEAAPVTVGDLVDFLQGRLLVQEGGAA